LVNLTGLIGIPFIDGGRNLTRGLDCFGLFREGYKRFGIELPDFKIFCYDSLSVSMALMEHSGQWEKISTPEIPCLVIMSTDPELPGIINHMGLYIGDNRVLHTMKKIKSSTFQINGSSLLDSFFTKKIQGYYRWIGN